MQVVLAEAEASLPDSIPIESLVVGTDMVAQLPKVFARNNSTKLTVFIFFFFNYVACFRDGGVVK